MNQDRMSQPKCGELFIKLCEGMSKIGGVGVTSSTGGEFGPSPNKFEAHKSAHQRSQSYVIEMKRLAVMDYIHSEIIHIKTTNKRNLTKHESLQLNLFTRMHNLFQDDVADPLELILGVVNTEPYTHLPILPHGQQALLDTQRTSLLTTKQHQIFQAQTAIKLLLEVGLGFYLLTRLEEMIRTLESEIKTLKASYSSGDQNARP